MFLITFLRGPWFCSHLFPIWCLHPREISSSESLATFMLLIKTPAIQSCVGLVYFF